MRAQQVIRGKRLGSIQDGAFRDEGSARCCSSQSVLTAWSASQGHDMGVCGLAAAGAVKAMSPGTADGGCACALAAVVHSSRGARSAIQHRPGWALKRSPAPRRLQPRQAGAGVWSALALHWHQSSSYTFPSAARFTLSPISLALSLSETALLHLHHPACALRRAAYRCLSCQTRTPAAKLLQAPTLRAVKPHPAAAPPPARRPLHSWYVPSCALLLLFAACAALPVRAFVAPQPSPPARRALASPPVTAAGLRARAGAVLLFAGSAVPPRSALPVSLHLHSLLAATKGFSTRLFTCLVLSPSAPAFPHSSTRP